MSHTVTIKTKITDLAAIQAACQRLKLLQPIQGEVRLFDRISLGISVQLNGLRIPLCIDSVGTCCLTTSADFGVCPRSLTSFNRLTQFVRRRSKRASKGHRCAESVLPHVLYPAPAGAALGGGVG